MHIVTYIYVYVLAMYIQVATNAVHLECPSISVSIPPKRRFLYVQITKLKAPLVVNRIIS